MPQTNPRIIVLKGNHILSVIFFQVRILNQCTSFSNKNQQVQLVYSKLWKILHIEESVRDAMMIRDCKHCAPPIGRKNFFRQRNQNFQKVKKQQDGLQIIIQCKKKK